MPRIPARHAGKRSGLTFFAPCLARLGAPPDGSQWAHEIKYDGYRVQAHVMKRGSQVEVKIFTRNGLDWTERFAALVPELARLPVASAILDGEAVATNASGRTSLEALQHALRSGDRAGLSITMMAFDLLYLDGHDLRSAPLSERKRKLADLLGVRPKSSQLQFSEHLSGPGCDILKKACALGLEGIVSKRLDRPYRSGRSGDWIKAKCTMADPFVVAGYVPNKSATQAVGSLVVGYYEGGQLRYAGRVGTGFSVEEAAAMFEGLQAIRRTRAPFSGHLKAMQQRDVVWLAPRLVAQIEYRAWTKDGLLRHASFKAFREDKQPEEVGPPDSLRGIPSSRE